jgi:hypothetical protein
MAWSCLPFPLDLNSMTIIPFFVPGGGRAVMLSPPESLSSLVCALDPSLYLEEGCLLNVKIDLSRTDTDIITELKEQMSDFRARFSIKRQTKRNKPDYDPIIIWDFVHDLIGKEILTDDEVNSFLWQQAGYIEEKYDVEDKGDTLYKGHSHSAIYEKLINAHNIARTKINSFNPAE